MDYIHKLRRDGTIRHIGLSTHNPRIGRLAVESGFVEMILFQMDIGETVNFILFHFALIMENMLTLHGHALMQDHASQELDAIIAVLFIINFQKMPIMCSGL